MTKLRERDGEWRAKEMAGKREDDCSAPKFEIPFFNFLIVQHHLLQAAVSRATTHDEQQLPQLRPKRQLRHGAQVGAQTRGQKRIQTGGGST
jgi:hypothetical protein